MTLWLWIAAPIIGIILGLFGAGGGMLTVPLLVYGGGVPLKEAIALSVWIVAFVSLVAALNQRAWKVVQWRLLVFFGFGGACGGVLGALLGGWVSEWLQHLLFSLLVLVVAWWMVKVKLSSVKQPDIPCNCPKTFVVGILLGIATGLLGVGGGFLMVPVLIMMGVSHLPTAVAHSLILISVNAIAAGITYLGVVPISTNILLSVAVLAGVGSIIGGIMLKRLPVGHLQKGFSAVLLGVGGMMLGDLFLF